MAEELISSASRAEEYGLEHAVGPGYTATIWPLAPQVDEQIIIRPVAETQELVNFN
jgi:hypothetical protein